MRRRSRIIDSLVLTSLISFLLVGCSRAAEQQATPNTLSAALKGAKPGDTVVVAPGTYGVLALSGVTFVPGVTIRGRGAVFKGLNLQNVQGLSLSGLEVSADCGAGLYPAVVYGSKDIAFDQVLVHGDKNCWAGLLLRESAGVTVTNSEFHHLQVGVSRLNSSEVTIADNAFHDLFSDGINGGGGSNISVLRNRMTNFRPSAGSHPDGVQFWTTNAPAPASNILIQGNVIDRGEGDVSTVSQGIFVELDSADRRWSNVRILDNVILGGMYNGIFAAGVDGLEVAGNTVAGYPDMENWIRISPDNTRVAIHHNTAQRYIDGKADLHVDSTNKSLPAVRDRGAAILARPAGSTTRLKL